MTVLLGTKQHNSEYKNNEPTKLSELNKKLSPIGTCALYYYRVTTTTNCLPTPTTHWLSVVSGSLVLSHRAAALRLRRATLAIQTATPANTWRLACTDGFSFCRVVSLYHNLIPDVHVVTDYIYSIILK